MPKETRQLKFVITRVGDGFAAGMTGAGAFVAGFGAPAVHATGLRERFIRSDRDALRGDVTLVGKTMRDALGCETKAHAERTGPGRQLGQAA